MSWAAGELARVVECIDPKANELVRGKLVVVRYLYGFRAMVQRVVAGPVSGVSVEVRQEHLAPVDRDELTDHECFVLMHNALTRGETL